MTHISFDPYIPLALWAPLALATAALLGCYALAGRRRLPAGRWWLITALMLLAAAVPLVVLLNPTWLERVPPPPGKPLLTILVDRSASMATRDAGQRRTRYEAAVALAADTQCQLSDRYEIRIRALAESEGSLVCFRGPPVSQISQRLGELMPLRWTPVAESRFHLQLTGAGEALRWLPGTAGENRLADLPSLATSVRPESAKALAVVLATGAASGSGPGTPVMVYQPVGNGRVVVVEGAGMWRWAFLPPEHQKREEVHGSLWRSLVRWLVANVGLLPGQKLSLRADKWMLLGAFTLWSAAWSLRRRSGLV
jgi:hypothetical protein